MVKVGDVHFPSAEAAARYADAAAEAELKATLRRAAGDAWAIAVPLTLLSLALLALFWRTGSMSRFAQTIGYAATGLCGLLPGVAYAVAAVGLRRRQAWAVEIGPFAVAGHAMVIVLGFAAGAALSAGNPQVARLPAFASAVFFPASLAFLLHTRKARLAASAFAQQHGFSPLMGDSAVAVEEADQAQEAEAVETDGDGTA